MAFPVPHLLIALVLLMGAAVLLGDHLSRPGASAACTSSV